MPRGPRLNIPDGIYHVMTRGNRKATIFEDARDRERFIEIVAESADKYTVRVLAENRLGNHYHQIVQTPLANLPDYMGFINGGFAQYSNWRHDRIGHVYNERYQPILIDNDFYLRIVTAYVLTNAVKHGLVTRPDEWEWSSYRPTVGLQAPPEYLSLDWLLSVFPSRSFEESQAAFCRYVRTSAPSDSQGWITPPAFGSSAFERELRAHIGATLFMEALPRSYRALARPPLSDLFPPGMPKQARNGQILRAHVLHAYRMSEIARALYMNPGSVSRIVADLRRRIRK